jgi:hypothetical protein
MTPGEKFSFSCVIRQMRKLNADPDLAGVVKH